MGVGAHSLPAPQVVVIDSAATRVAVGDARGIDIFAQDAPGNVPLQRWDQENPSLARLAGRAPTRFAAFMQGIVARSSHHADYVSSHRAGFNQKTQIWKFYICVFASWIKACRLNSNLIAWRDVSRGFRCHAGRTGWTRLWCSCAHVVLAAGVEDFDAGLFRISPAEAAAMDAQQRLLLEASHLVIASAQPPPQRQAAARTRVAAL